MSYKRTIEVAGALCCLFFASLACGQPGGPRGKAELQVSGGVITVDYGRPALKGRDMLSQLQAGDFWRMGTNTASVINTPVDLAFGSVKVPKGSYSLWLKKVSEDKYELVFNSETGQWGTKHDPSKDVHQVPLSKTAAQPTETFTIDLQKGKTANSGLFVLTWGTTQLSSNFSWNP
jgi:hypothetical protein